ncbi:multiple C2 and transmembrane domain-containing protein-like isoform X2 [Pectinophora gossypiella]|uniref:multiple C2 and transmembrane domain-containing protein-like isoform X2 n=1 Tax=Pectinophora gossypiella TaxID=13191 RepID=UPI00214EA108|nr:multiple C2 and transmembrane domain-containing protein-like isoform X2 [Pectinophora gossypiella]
MYAPLQWSFAIPDGMTMDPMAPTALAISTEFMDRIGSGLTILRDHGKKLQKYVNKHKFEVIKRSWKSIVNVVLVEAKDLPDGPAGGSNGLYCKFKLGAETHKSKQVPKTKPTWRERFNLYVYEDNNLEVTVWHKGKQKNFMGRCSIDLSQLEKEKTHDLWQELECGYGSVHMLVTLSATARNMQVDNVPTTNGISHAALPEDDYSWYRLDSNWSEVGQLSVTVLGARGLCALGLSGKADAYCVLELDNSRVQTHTVRSTNDPMWNKSYNFPVNDITSTLDITVYDESIITSMKGETLGKISIPLLRINNDEKRWYALKDRNKKSSARGNCPRVLLQMSVVWNPVKASVRVLTPKETKYMQKPPKFDIPLIYSNLKFIKDVFHAIYIGNEHLKRVFEWENREKNTLALIGWLMFWHFFRLWMTPLVLLIPFVYNWTGYRSCNNNALVACSPCDDDMPEEDVDVQKDEKTIKTRIYGLQDLTLTIKNGIDYIVSLLERIKHLATFTVPYLSYLAMLVLVAASVVLYFVPVRFLFMALGIYKYTRKYVNPDRVPNNDLLDFLSRLPDNEITKQWRELKVPEPNINRTESIRRQ